MPTELPAVVTSPLNTAQQTAVINLVRRTARTEILPRFRNLGGAQIATKSGPHDLVTEADTAAEAMIARGLARMFPGAVILGEEAAATNPSLRKMAAEAELAFIIDPIDGTWNFAHGLGVFGIILSATRYGTPVFGLIFDPLADDYVIADTTTPSTHVMANGRSVEPQTALGGAASDLTGIAHMSYMTKEDQETLAPLVPRFASVGSLRCSAHEYRLLAMGKLDFTLSATLNPWDHAAGVLICQRAGGVAKFLDGSAYRIDRDSGFLLCACNAQTWDTLAEALSPLLERT